MTANNETWFLSQRSEALAGLVLMSRNDLEVRSEQKVDTGADFLVNIRQDNGRAMRLFTVQVRGTVSSDTSEWMKTLKELLTVEGGQVFLPTCVFIINVRSNQPFYRWVAEPVIENEEAKLRIGEPGDFEPLTRSVVDGIVGSVNRWYDAIPRQLMAAKK